jgi:hypothetical protein
MKINDETLPIINKPKHPKKNEYKEQNGRTHIQENKRTTQEGEPQREHKVPKPLLIARSISNKERGRPPERMLDLDKSLFIAIPRFKIETAYTHCNAINTFCI